jgi:DNA-binding CsgD family transcriptional regulator
MIKLLPLRQNIPIVISVSITLIALLYQIFIFINNRKEKERIYHALFLSLVLIENIVENLFILPDNILPYRIQVQEILREASGYIVSAFIPLYTYKLTGFRTLRPHIYYGFIFILLPTILFFSLYYPKYGTLTETRRYVYIIPFLYGCWGFWTMIKSTREAYCVDQNKPVYLDRIYLIIALIFWATGPLIGAWLGGSRCMIGIWGCTPVLIYNIYYILKGHKFHPIQKGDQQREPNPNLSLLTPREKEIVELICEGLTSRVISEKLFISEATVKTHTSNIYKKFGVVNKMELRNKIEFKEKQTH